MIYALLDKMLSDKVNLNEAPITIVCGYHPAAGAYVADAYTGLPNFTNHMPLYFQGEDVATAEKKTACVGRRDVLQPITIAGIELFEEIFFPGNHYLFDDEDRMRVLLHLNYNDHLRTG